MRRFAPVLLTLALASSGLRAATQKTTIIVEVKNQHEKPVDNASVILDFLGSRQITKLGMKRPIHWEVRTNQQGLAHFPPIPEGTVQLQVITKKYQTFGQKMDVSGEEKKVDITLQPPQSQYSAHEPLKPAEPKPDTPPKEDPKQ